MHVVRFDKAPFYEAPGHLNMKMRRLQGREAGPSDVIWLGVSQLEPGGGIASSASDVEKLYIVLDGEISLSNGVEEIVLGRWDSCRIGVNEPRTMTNKTDRLATVLLAMPLPLADRAG
jgi:hypothetical protein